MSSFTKQGKTPSVKVHCCVCTFYSIPNDGAQGAASAQFPFNELLFLGLSICVVAVVIAAFGSISTSHSNHYISHARIQHKTVQQTQTAAKPKQ